MEPLRKYAPRFDLSTNGMIPTWLYGDRIVEMQTLKPRHSRFSTYSHGDKIFIYRQDNNEMLLRLGGWDCFLEYRFTKAQEEITKAINQACVLAHSELFRYEREDVKWSIYEGTRRF